MSILPSFGRALSKRLVSRPRCLPSQCVRALRVAATPKTSFLPVQAGKAITSQRGSRWTERSYATAASKAPRAARAPRKAGTKKTTKPKTTKKPKSTRKTKPKRKELTEIQKARLAKQKENKVIRDAKTKQKTLKETALLGKEPKTLPATAWLVISAETNRANPGQLTNNAKRAADRYKSLTAQEREQFNHVANENKAKNEAAYKRWVSSFTADRVREANSARRALNSESRKTAKDKNRTHRYIQDDRLVLPNRAAYNFYVQERYQSGDFTGVSVGEAGKLLGREWKALSATDKKPFETQAAGDRRRYLTEYKTVYGKDPPTIATAKK